LIPHRGGSVDREKISRPTLGDPDVILSRNAEVAELADAPALGAGGRKAVGVRVPSSADLLVKNPICTGVFLCFQHIAKIRHSHRRAQKRTRKDSETLKMAQRHSRQVTQTSGKLDVSPAEIASESPLGPYVHLPKIENEVEHRNYPSVSIRSEDFRERSIPGMLSTGHVGSSLCTFLPVNREYQYEGGVMGFVQNNVPWVQWRSKFKRRSRKPGIRLESRPANRTILLLSLEREGDGPNSRTTCC
jgi:hypothetical protein